MAHTADDLLNDTLLTDDQKAEMDEAGEFLRSMLAKQPQRRETLVQLARKEGISSRSLDKAKKKLGIRHTKLGMHLGPTGAYTVWHLGNTVAADDALYPEPDYTNGKVDDVEGVDDFPYEQATLR